MGEKKNYAWPITAISKENYQVIVDCIQSNIIFRERQILIFGAGIRGAELAVIMQTQGLHNIVFTDNNSEKWGGMVDTHPIISVEEALRLRGRVVAIISVEEGSEICGQLETAGFVRDEDYFYPLPNLYERFISEFKRPLHNKILMMGDCMFEVVAFGDANKDSLTEMFHQKFGYENVKLLTMHGMGLPAFYHVLKAQINMGYKPDVFVVMLNLETLTGKQHLLPRSQHTKLMQAVSELAPDPDGELKRYYQLTQERVKNVQAEFFTTDKFSAGHNYAGMISDSASRVFFKLHYMYELDTNIESLVYLRKIMKLGEEQGINIIPFVPPVNYERGTELFGAEFESAYSKNLQKLAEMVKSGGAEILDLSHTCVKEEFAHVTTPDETTNYAGRCKITDAICTAVERMI